MQNAIKLHKAQRERLKAIIYDSVELEEFDEFAGIDIDKDLCEKQQKINFIRDRFSSEYKWHIEKLGSRVAIMEWLQGLAINVPFMTYEIEHELGFEDGTEVGQYWKELANTLHDMIYRGQK